MNEDSEKTLRSMLFSTIIPTSWSMSSESIFADVAKKEELDEKAKAFFFILFMVELVR